MKKILMILAGSAFLTAPAFASDSRGSRDYLPAGYCMKNNCTNHESLSSIQGFHAHKLTIKKPARINLEERRLWERGSRGSVRN